MHKVYIREKLVNDLDIDSASGGKGHKAGNREYPYYDPAQEELVVLGT